MTLVQRVKMTAMVYLTSDSRASFHKKGYLVCYMDSYHKDETNAKPCYFVGTSYIIKTYI